MISGYVIFYSAKSGSASKSAVSRTLRVYPSYWFAVLFTSTFIWWLGGDTMKVYGSQVLINMTLLQTYLNFGHVDGVYWTLVYEIQFYFAVLVVLILGMQKHLERIFI